MVPRALRSAAMASSTEGPSARPTRESRWIHCTDLTRGHGTDQYNGLDFLSMEVLMRLAGVDAAGSEYRRPEFASAGDGPLAAVGAEHHRQVIGSFRDDRHGPGHFLPVDAQVRQ